MNLDAHPAAELFPMLNASDLAELADDIAEHGLLHPIVVDADRRILDGRNRLAACELADVEPTFVIWEGDDPYAYVVSANLRRRHLRADQRAQIVIDLWVATGWSTRRIAGVVGVSHETVRTDLAGVKFLTPAEPAEPAEPETVTGRDGKTYPARKPVEINLGGDDGEARRLNVTARVMKAIAAASDLPLLEPETVVGALKPLQADAIEVALESLATWAERYRQVRSHPLRVVGKADQ